MSLFLLIAGIGEKTAESLEHELGSPQSLEEAYEMLKTIFARLPIATQQEITYQPIRIIPHELIESLEPFFPKNMVIAGSYRRKMPYSGDLDVVCLTPNPIKEFEDSHKIKVIEPFSDGKDRVSCLFFLKDYGFYVRCDFFITDQETYAYMLFHATGSKVFNIRMRKQAQKLGMKLSQYGLWKGKELIPALSEEDIMSALKLEYVKPEDRDH